MPDATNEEIKATPPSSSDENKPDNSNSLNASESDKTQDEGELGSDSQKFNERFKSVYSKMKEYERTIEELNGNKKSISNQIPETEKEALDALYGYFKQKDIEQERAKEEKLNEAIANINSQLDEIKKSYPSINKDEVWEFMEKNGITSPFEAVLKINAELEKKNLNKDNKDASQKIGAGKPAKNIAGKMTYDQLKKMSLDDISL